MSKLRKNLFRISVTLNIILLGLVAWGFMNNSFVKEQVFFTEVEHNLVELEGLIESQIKSNWTSPNVVTTELGEVLNGIQLGIATSEQLGRLNKDDKNILRNLYNRLNKYPTDDLYKFIELTEEDKRNFSDLRDKLRKAGFGIGIQYNRNWEEFIKKVTKLDKMMQTPLHIYIYKYITI